MLFSSLPSLGAETIFQGLRLFAPLIFLDAMNKTLPRKSVFHGGASFPIISQFVTEIYDRKQWSWLSAANHEAESATELSVAVD